MIHAGDRWPARRIAAILNRCTIVRWDRLTDGEQDGGHRNVTVYGWVDRTDGRSDFVVLEFGSWTDQPGFLTSSAEHERELYRQVFEEDGEPSQPCKRVEDELPTVDNAIRLEPRR